MKTCDCNQGRLPCSCKHREGTRFPNPRRGTEFAYNAGVDARDADVPKAAPGGLGVKRKSWWLAGYNDRDIELQVLARNQRKGQSEELRHIMLSDAEIQTYQRSEGL